MDNELKEMMGNDKSDTECPLNNQDNHCDMPSMSARELCDKSLPSREHIMFPWLLKPGLAMLYGHRGLGKSFLALFIAITVAIAGRLFKWAAPVPRVVLYIDGEMPLADIQGRLKSICDSLNCQPPETLLFLNDEILKGQMPNLSTAAGRAKIKKLLLNHNVSLMIVDNVSTLCGSKQNFASSWRPIQDWALTLRKLGISILFIHHSNKAGLQRGTGEREDILDVIIRLERPQNYQPTDGARFQIHYDKSRGFWGDDAKPFEATLITSEGKHEWKTAEISE